MIWKVECGMVAVVGDKGGVADDFLPVCRVEELADAMACEKRDCNNCGEKEVVISVGEGGIGVKGEEVGRAQRLF